MSTTGQRSRLNAQRAHIEVYHKAASAVPGEAPQEGSGLRRLPARFSRGLLVAANLARETTRFLRYIRTSEQARRPDIPVHFVQTLLDLGPTFVKLGQILSTRPDFLPEGYIHELERLQENVPPYPMGEVRALVKAEFGKPIEALFPSFEETPAAAASLAQVHFAQLPDGTEVAVKVQRPHVPEIIHEDLVILGAFIRLLTLAGGLLPKAIKNLSLKDGFEEFRRYTLQELDFSREGRTIEHFRKNFQAWPDVVIPEVYWGYTTGRVLTMSRLTGLRLKEHIKRLTLQGRRALNRRLLEMELKMFVSDGLFHADLHPGNILFGDDGTIGLLDFGMYGQITDRQRDHFILYFFAIVQHQIQRAFYHLSSLASREPHADEKAYYGRFRELAEGFLRSTLSEKSFTQVYLQLLIEGARYGYVFPSELLLQAKAVTTAEALMLTLVPDLKFEDEARPIVLRQFADRVTDFGRIRQRIENTLPEVLLLGELPPASVLDDSGPNDTSLFTEVLSELAIDLVDKADLWNRSAGLLPLALKPFIKDALTERGQPNFVEPFVDRLHAEYEALLPTVSTQESLGGELMVHLAALTAAMHRYLVSTGLSESESRELVYDIAWRAYTKMGQVPWLLGAKLGTDGMRRLRFALDAFLTFPFSSPAYEWQPVEAEENVVAFDMVKCPVAEYFRSQGLEKLCVDTWCNLDFPLAQQWGATLERKATLASGADRCDFRWRWTGDGRI